MRLGIWCAYGETLGPTGGIGVFVHNLVRGLVAVDDVENIVLVVRAGDEHVVAATVAAAAGRVATAALHRLPWTQRWRWRWHRARHRRLCNRIAAGDAAAAVLGRREARERALDSILAGQRLDEPPHLGPREVWLLPHVDVDRPFGAPTVVVVHDMVPLHFPGVIPARKLEAFRRRVERVVGRATLVGTMSRAIRDTDIVGLLGCPPEKVRVVPGAIPVDFGEPIDRDALLRRHPVAGRRYLLYPAANRPYKNHALLVEALAALHRRGHGDLELVFTGFDRLREPLAGRVAAAGLIGRVHPLGTVDRSTLAGLYRQAAATVVPSLYEQGSYPVLEAISHGCPAAASDIPALREFLGPLQASVPLFDPRSPESAADAVAALLADRGAAVREQRLGLESLHGRSWADVAADWVAVFRESVARQRA